MRRLPRFMFARAGVSLALLGMAGCAYPRAQRALLLSPNRAAMHPLEPLGEAEMRAAVETIRDSGRLTPQTRFAVVALQEPAKDTVLAHRPGQPFPREAFLVLYDRGTNLTCEAVVDLNTRAIKSWRDCPGAQPAVLDEDYELAEECTRADANWQAAIRRRGISDFDRVFLDGWAPGHLGVPNAAPGARLLRVLAYDREGLSERINPYARPIEGLVAVVDLNRRQVVQIIDSGLVALAPAAARPKQPVTAASSRADVSGCPRAPDISIRGNEVRWKKWTFRVSIHPREGLVLRTIGWDDGGRVRPILYRAGLSEMVVPYADPDDAWCWRNAFDEGEYGIGRSANSLEPGLDVPHDALLFDVPFCNEAGEPSIKPRVLAIYERDAGLLWRHYDYSTGRTEGARGRQLVVMCMVSIGNYDYGTQWIFNEDGTIEMQIMLTGILLPKGVEAQRCGACPGIAAGADAATSGSERFGTLVAQRVVAVNHQHFFNFRMDFDVDGPANSLAEMNTAASPASGENSHANAFGMREALLRSERQARRGIDVASHREWKVFNPGRANRLGHLAAYALVPGDNAIPYVAPDSALRRRAGFIHHHVWATQYAADEMHAAGDYPNQSHGGDGLSVWTDDDQPLVNKDLVLWYTFGLTHVPRAEEWPVMPTARTGFRLVPCGFFEQSPAMDGPRVVLEE